MSSQIISHYDARGSVTVAWLTAMVEMERDEVPMLNEFQANPARRIDGSIDEYLA